MCERGATPADEPPVGEAFAALRRALELGGTNPGAWGHDPDLACLRARPDFNAWLDALLDRAFPADPFARAP